ncbi:MAG TPA: prepilin peptidase [Bryobacteraceae bacterium]|jgi:leader peptidase (prepilin peptidase)/N-methyltransferase|nr:prepilin peptidase [Bryobacteraceae bacterium]
MESFVALVFGLLIGSFLNVCIHRWPRGRSVVRPRSHCVRCRKMIPWYDNIPLLSYLALRGRCRYCGCRISLRYPTVELFTGAVFFYFVRTLGATALAAKMCVLGAILIALVFSDLEKRILPDELTLGGALAGMAFAAFVPLHDDAALFPLLLLGGVPPGRMEWLATAAISAFLPAFFLWGGGWLYLKLRHREGLGFGDVKLMVMVGAFLGLLPTLEAMLYGSLAGSVIGLLYIWITKKDASSYPLPFGSFLGLAALAVAVWTAAHP